MKSTETPGNIIQLGSPKIKCDVCSSFTIDSQSIMILCSVCKNYIHINCLFNSHQEKDGLFKENWTCDKCVYMQKNKTESTSLCEFCPETRGIVKRYDIAIKKKSFKNHIYAHPFCVKNHSSYLTITSQNLKEFILFNEKFMKMENGKKPVCLVCGEKKGVCLRCEFSKNDKALKRCPNYFHAICLKYLGLFFSEKVNNILFPEKKKILCPYHFRIYLLKYKPVIDNLKKEIKASHKDYEYLKEILDFFEYFKNLILEEKIKCAVNSKQPFKIVNPYKKIDENSQSTADKDNIDRIRSENNETDNCFNLSTSNENKIKVVIPNNAFPDQIIDKDKSDLSDEYSLKIIVIPEQINEDRGIECAENSSNDLDLNYKEKIPKKKLERPVEKIQKLYNLKVQLDYNEIAIIKTRTISDFLESCSSTDEIYIDYQVNLTHQNKIKVLEIIPTNPPYKLNFFPMTCYDNIFEYERVKPKNENDRMICENQIINNERKINEKFKFLGDYNFSTCLSFFN